MSSPLPWSVQGLAPEARDAAEAAARRSGLPLGDWLNRVIFSQPEIVTAAQRAERASVPPTGLNFDVSASIPPRFAFGDLRNAPAAEPQSLPPTANSLIQSIGELARRLEAAEQRTTQVVTSIDRAVSAIATRIDTADRMKALSDSAIASAAEALTQSSREQAQAFAAVEGSVHGLADRVSRLERQQPAANALGEAQKVLQTLSAQVDSAEKRTNRVIEGLTSSVQTLAEKVVRLQREHSDHTERVASRLDRVEANAERALKLAETASAAHEQTLKRLDETATALEALGKERAVNARGEIEALDNAIEGFGAKLHSVEKRSAEAAQTIEEAVKNLAQRLDSAEKRQKDTLSSLQQMLGALPGRAAAPQPPQPSYAPQPARMPIEPAPQTFAQQPEFAAPEFAAPQFAPPPQPAPRFAEPQFAPPPPPAYGPRVEPDGIILPDPDDLYTQDATPRQDDFLAAARRAAQAAASRNDAAAERGFKPFASYDTNGEVRRKAMSPAVWIALGVIAIMTVVLIVLLLPYKNADNGGTIDRPAPGASIGEILAPPQPAPAQPASPWDETLPPVTFDEAPANAAPPVETPEEESPAAGEEAPPAPAATPAPAEGGVASLTEAAGKGDARAQYLLGARYAEGNGVGKDEAQAAKWFQRAAENGLVIAQYRLGTLYERGRGVPKDLAQARAWYERAAGAGNRKAMHNLAVIYASGDSGAPDYTQAARWFTAAAELGLKDSQYNLAILYERGLGVAENPVEAYRWYAIAAAQGDSDSAARMTELATRLTPDQLADGRTLASAFKPKPLDRDANDLPPG